VQIVTLCPKKDHGPEPRNLICRQEPSGGVVRGAIHSGRRAPSHPSPIRRFGPPKLRQRYNAGGARRLFSAPSHSRSGSRSPSFASSIIPLGSYCSDRVGSIKSKMATLAAP
jgi:hypothetical protein